MSEPLVSIIIPSYNRAHLIGETLDSVLAQTYSKWECIIVDDGSTDDTEVIVRDYINKDLRFKYYNRPNSYLPGGNGARNYGTDQSNGAYLIFLDSDDLLSPIALKNRVEHIGKQSIDMTISLTGVFYNKIGDTDILWNRLIVDKSAKNLLSRFFEIDMPWHTSGVTWSSKCLKENSGWNENLRAWQDWELHCRVLFNRPKIELIFDEPDNYFRNSRHDSISDNILSPRYIESVKQALFSIHQNLAIKGSEFNSAKESFKKLLCRMLIRHPIKNGKYNFAIKQLIYFPFHKYDKKTFFVKFFLVELVGKSFTLKKVLVDKKYAQHNKYLKIKNTYLKSKFNESIAITKS